MVYRILALVIGFTLACVQEAGAQDAMDAYGWERGDLVLVYPASWDEPYSDETGEHLELRLAQVYAADAASRPTGVQVITVAVVDGADKADVGAAAVQASLAALGISASSPGSGEAATTLASASGTSADGLLVGLARVIRLTDGRTLILSGRSLASHEGSFRQLFETVASSLAPGAHARPVLPAYGVLWRTESSASDTLPLLRMIALADAAPNLLYALDVTAGLVRIDGSRGDISRMEDGSVGGAVDLAVDGTGRLYLAVPGCHCIRILSRDGYDEGSIGGFRDGMPATIAVTREGTLYATDWDENGYFVHVYAGHTWQARLDGLTSAPALTIDRAGRLLAITSAGDVLALESSGFTPIFQLPSVPEIRDADVDLNNNLVIATADEGVMIVDSSGTTLTRLGQLVPNTPRAGEFVAPRAVTVGDDGTIYVVDSDGTFGAVTALNLTTRPDRIGDVDLTPGQAVQGWLDAHRPQQAWTYQGSAGEQLTVSAVDVSRAGRLDLALRLIAPDGTEAAYNDDQLGLDLYGALDAQIAGETLEQTGTYTVIVERVDGEGAYSLGMNPQQTFGLVPQQAIRLEGALLDAVPGTLWRFEGEAGQVITVTMRAENAALDPMLNLYAPDGELIAWNDDAADPAFGTDAQLVLVELPDNGTYTLEATRFEGAGPYTLTVMVHA